VLHPDAKMGPDYIVVNSASDHLPCNASIVLKVDDRERRWYVHLPQGIPAGSNRVRSRRPAHRRVEVVSAVIRA